MEDGSAAPSWIDIDLSVLEPFKESQTTRSLRVSSNYRDQNTEPSVFKLVLTLDFEAPRYAYFEPKFLEKIFIEVTITSEAECEGNVPPSIKELKTKSVVEKSQDTGEFSKTFTPEDDDNDSDELTVTL